MCRKEGGSIVLTKDLVKYSRSKDKIIPSSIDVEKVELLDLARDLINLYAFAEGRRRDDLEEEASLLVNAFSQPIIARGLNRLCLDRCEFTQAQEINFSEARSEIFTLSAKLLEQYAGGDYEIFEDVMSEKVPEQYQALIHENLYGDLPESDLLIKFKGYRPVDLLHRYNLAQAQYLLLFCSEMELTLRKVESAQLRKIFKYLKFFRLLAHKWRGG